MSTPVISPPPGFQLEQDDSAAVKPPAGFQLEGNHSPNQGTVGQRSQPQGIAGTSQVSPPGGFELEKSAMPVQVQQPITPPQPKVQPARGRPPVSRVKTTQTKQAGSTVHDLTVQNRPQDSSSNELEAGERIRQIQTPQQQQSDVVIDSILHPERYYPSFIESMAPGMREAMGNRVAAAIRAGLEPPMPSESTAAARKLSGIPTLAPPAGPDLKHPAGVSYWTNPRTGQRVLLDAVPEQQAIPILDSWIGLEPMATGLTRMRENNPSKMYFTWDAKGRLVPHVEYVPGQAATPEEIARHNRQQMLGMAETLQGGMQVASPFMVGTAATAPVKAGLWLAAGYGAEETGGALLHGHVSPEAEDLARTLLVMAPGVFGAVGGLKTGGVRSRVVPLTPETFETFIKPNLRPGYVTDFAEFQLRNPNVTHMTVVQSGGRVGVSALGTEQQMRPLVVTAGGASLFGGKLRGGVAGTPEAYGGGIGIGRTNLTVRIPRSRGTTETTPQEAAQTIIRYDQRVGNLPAPKPPAPATPPGPPHLALENIQQLSAAIGKLPEIQRGDAMAQAHRLMTAWMLDRTGQSFLGPDHKLHIVNSPAEAQKLALQFINDQVDIHDKRLAESTKAAQEPQSFNSPSVAGLRIPSAALPGRIAAMGRNMTADSPAVRRVQSQARPIPGQVPEVKVKREPLQVQTALALPPAPVSAEEVGRIGQTDLRTGRQVLQPSNSLVQNERLAGESAPYLTTKLSEAAAAIPGARFDRLRPQKGLQRLEEKVADGKPPSTIGDNLAAQIVANTVAAKDQLIARLGQQFPVISVDDKFLEPREKAGYPSTNVQVQMPNGGTAEVQIVTPEIQAITDQTHRLYTLGRNFPEGSPERARYWDQAAAMHQQALEKFLARNAQPSTTTLTPGEKVVLRNGQIGKVVGPSRDLRRVVVRTGNGLRTVRRQDIRLDHGLATPKFARLAGGVRNEKIRKLMDAFVLLKAEDALDKVVKVESSVEQGSEKLPDLIWANHPATHLIWHWKAPLEPPFTGIFLDLASAREVAEKFETAVTHLKNADRATEAVAAEQVARHIRRVAAKDGAVAIGLRTGEEGYDLTTSREERAHVIQNRIGGGDIEKHANLAKLWLEPEFRNASIHLIRYGYRNNPPTMALEVATKLLAGEGDSLGLNDAEQKSALRKYLQSIMEQNGANAADDLILVAEPKYHRVFEEVKHGTRSKTR